MKARPVMDYDLPDTDFDCSFVLDGRNYSIMDGDLYKEKKPGSGEFTLVSDTTRPQREACIRALFAKLGLVEFGSAVVAGAASVLASQLLALAGKRYILGTHILNDNIRGRVFILNAWSAPGCGSIPGNIPRKLCKVPPTPANWVAADILERVSSMRPLKPVRQYIADRMDIVRVLLDWAQFIFRAAELEQTVSSLLKFTRSELRTYESLTDQTKSHKEDK